MAVPVEYALLPLGLLQGTTIAWSCSRGQKLFPALPREKASAVRALAHIHFTPVAPLPDQPAPLAALTPPLDELRNDKADAAYHTKELP